MENVKGKILRDDNGNVIETVEQFKKYFDDKRKKLGKSRLSDKHLGPRAYKKDRGGPYRRKMHQDGKPLVGTMSQVHSGNAHETTSGLTASDIKQIPLGKGKGSRYVSKKRHNVSKKNYKNNKSLKAWTDALKQAKRELGDVPPAEIKKGTKHYALAKKIYNQKMGSRRSRGSSRGSRGSSRGRPRKIKNLSL